MKQFRFHNTDMKNIRLIETVILTLFLSVTFSEDSNENKKSVPHLKDFGDYGLEAIPNSGRLGGHSEESHTHSKHKDNSTTAFTLSVLYVIWILWMSGVLFLLYKEHEKIAAKISEIVVFSSVYFEMAACMALFMPLNIESSEKLVWLRNGSLGGVLSMIASVVIWLIYAKLVKVVAKRDCLHLCLVRAIFLGVILMAGLIPNAITFIIGLTLTPSGGGNWLRAVGVIVLIQILTALTAGAITIIKVQFYKHNTKEEKRQFGLPKKEHSDEALRSSSRVHKVSHVRSIAGLKAEPEAVKRTQSTGTVYYEHVIHSAGKVKSISMYDALQVQSRSGAVNPVTPPKTATVHHKARRHSSSPYS